MKIKVYPVENGSAQRITAEFDGVRVERVKDLKREYMGSFEIMLNKGDYWLILDREQGKPYADKFYEKLHELTLMTGSFTFINVGEPTEFNL